MEGGLRNRMWAYIMEGGYCVIQGRSTSWKVGTTSWKVGLCFGRWVLRNKRVVVVCNSSMSI